MEFILTDTAERMVTKENAKYLNEMQAINTQQDISCIIGDKEDIYIEVIGLGQDVYTELNHVTGSRICTCKNDSIQDDSCSKDTCDTKVIKHSYDSSNFIQTLNSTVHHEGEVNGSSVESVKTPNHSGNCRKGFYLFVGSLCLALITGSVALVTLFLYTTSHLPRVTENRSDVFFTKTETLENSSDCMKTVSNELFEPLKRYADLEIDKYRRRYAILRNITYNLKHIKTKVKYWKYGECVKNPSASDKNVVFETDYRLQATLFFFNRSNVHSSVLYSHVPMIDVDCNFNVIQSPVTVSFSYIKVDIAYLRRNRQSYHRKYNNTITLPPFSKYVEVLNVPGVELTFPYAAVIQTYNMGALQETFQEGEVIVEMQLENEKILEYKLDSYYDNCWD